MYFLLGNGKLHNDNESGIYGMDICASYGLIDYITEYVYCQILTNYKTVGITLLNENK